MIEERTLGELIADRKGTRSYERLSTACGGTPTAKRLHQLATKPQRNFPDPPTIKGLAQGLGVSVTDVVMAAARMVGLSVGVGNDPHSLTLPNAGELPASAREAIESVTREFVKMHIRAQASFDIAEIVNRNLANVKDVHNDEEQESRTQESSAEHGGTGGSGGQPGAPIVAANTAAGEGEPLILSAILKSRSADNDEALTNADQGSQADVPPTQAELDLAQRKGETKRQWELRTQIQPEDEPQGEAPEGGA
ncbi:hypothetical protein [Rhodococcoides fascians]|uniref:hypothetical protein n=1 Tax=Rhodococcoides fascians TaxID=1828 RepID=UPI00050BF2C5|nr:hypothetical protein [Rhodococcus fascians]